MPVTCCILKYIETIEYLKQKVESFRDHNELLALQKHSLKEKLDELEKKIEELTKENKLLLLEKDLLKETLKKFWPEFANVIK